MPASKSTLRRYQQDLPSGRLWLRAAFGREVTSPNTDGLELNSNKQTLLLVAFGAAYAWMAVAARGAPDVPPGATCGTARSVIARTICNDIDLARLSRETRVLYRKARFVGDRRSQVQLHWSWIVERDRTCGRKSGRELKACLSQALNARIANLHRTLEREPAQISSRPPSATETRPDCSMETAQVARAICGDAKLRHWEDRLAKFYQRALEESAVENVLTDDQRRWMDERTQQCTPPSVQMVDCLLRMTKRRVEELALVIHTRDDPEDRIPKVEKILIGTTPPLLGLDAETIDRESDRADQSELALESARACVRKNAGAANISDVSGAKQAAELAAAACFGEFSRQMTALELGALAQPSFDMLVGQELGARK
jgi:uncharacterized protein